jgi:phytanoyl-CoA hydroxylase
MEDRRLIMNEGGGMYGGEYRVTEEQIRFYEENGFVQLHDVLTAEEVQTLRTALDVAIADRDRLKANWGPREDEGYTKVFLQMVNVWERYAALEEYSVPASAALPGNSHALPLSGSGTTMP